MRPSVPKASVVETAFRVLAKRLANTTKRINHEAAREMKTGHYEDAERWMEVGRAVGEFGARAEAYAAEWKTLVRTSRLASAAAAAKGAIGSAGGRADRGPRAAHRTPAWRFYQPVLRAVLRSGLEATHAQVLSSVGVELAGQFSAKDLALSPKGRVPKWHLTVRGVRRHCLREGWLEPAPKEMWRLSEKGRRVASEAETPDETGQTQT